MIRYFTLLLCSLSLLFCATSCYRMPTEEDYSLIPLTNNPDYTREKGKQMPNVRY